MVGHYQAAELTNKGVRATGQSLTALATGDGIVDRTGKNVAAAMQRDGECHHHPGGHDHPDRPDGTGQ